jgi:hypothetical protein
LVFPTKTIHFHLAFLFQPSFCYTHHINCLSFLKNSGYSNLFFSPCALQQATTRSFIPCSKYSFTSHSHNSPVTLVNRLLSHFLVTILFFIALTSCSCSQFVLSDHLRKW